MNQRKAFSNHRTNGVYLSFPNGWGISTIWGWGSYTENHDIDDGWAYDPEKLQHQITDSNDVEVMPDVSDKLLKRLQKRYDSSDTVFGHMDITEWLWLVNLIAEQAPKEQV